MAAADSNRVYVPMGMADSLGVIDLESRQVTSSMSGTVNTHGSALTPDGRYAVSTHPMSGDISIVDLDSGKLVKSVATGPAPNYVVETEGGQSLLVR